MSPRLSRITSSTGALRLLLKDLGMEGALEFGIITERWSTLFSGPLSVHTSPASLSGSTLTVNVDSPSWLHQAAFYRTQMLQKLHDLGVSSIRFRQGPVRAAHVEPAAAPQFPPAKIDPDVRQEVERMLSEIEDDELRDTIRRAALRSLMSAGRGRFGDGAR